MPEPLNWDLIAKYIAGECNEEEISEIKYWIKENPKNEKLINSLKKGWNLNSEEYSEIDSDKIWNELASKAGIDKSDNQNKIFNLNKNLVRYAAVLLILILPLIYFASGIFNDEQLISIKIPKGSNKTLTLADGSTIKLDAGSEIKYSNKFNEETREVYLSGEGFFEIKHNPDKPFIVHFKENRVKVLGTIFNISSWPERSSEKVFVKEGKVLFANNNDEVILIKNQFSKTTKSGSITEPSVVESNKITGWMGKNIYFENEKFENILLQLKRWYNIDFNLPNKNIGNEHLSIHLQKKSLEEIIKVLSLLTNLDYDIQDNIVEFKEK